MTGWLSRALLSRPAMVLAVATLAGGAEACGGFAHEHALPNRNDPDAVRGRPSYSLTFATDRDVAPAAFNATFHGLATWPYFGGESAEREKGQVPGHWTMLLSRTWSGLLDLYVDNQLCPGAPTPSVAHGVLRITAYPLSPEDQKRCSMPNRPWASSIITSQPSFSQTYGYWEIEAKLPCVPGRWPAFWLLPAQKTATNGGRLAEIDVMEHYGGTITVMSKGVPFVINRVGQPFATVHYGKTGAEQKFTNAQSLPHASDEDRAAFCRGWHRFAVDWTKTTFRFFVDGRQTLSAPNPGVDDPHYWVLNLDISKSAGDPALDPAPSNYDIRWVKVWPARPDGA